MNTEIVKKVVQFMIRYLMHHLLLVLLSSVFLLTKIGGLDTAKSLWKTYVNIRNDGSVSEEAITPEMRAKAFKESIDPKALSDPIYYAGVEAAPILKRLRNEPIFTDG